MGKYEPLGQFLKKQKRDRVNITFAEIEHVIGMKLPKSSKSHRAWWSNNPSNNVMTKEWLAAGYETEEVDIAREKLVFRKSNVERATGLHGGKQYFIGSMKGMFTFPEDFDPERPFDGMIDWEGDWKVDKFGKSVPKK